MKTTRMIAVAAATLFIGKRLGRRTWRSRTRLDVRTHGDAAPRNRNRRRGQDDPEPARKRLVSLIVDYPPGASSASHRHARSAFIYAYVLSGEIRSAVDDEPARVYRAGESWFESPGAHHRVSANASDSQAGATARRVHRRCSR